MRYVWNCILFSSNERSSVNLEFVIPVESYPNDVKNLDKNIFEKEVVLISEEKVEFKTISNFHKTGKSSYSNKCFSLRHHTVKNQICFKDNSKLRVISS